MNRRTLRCMNPSIGIKKKHNIPALDGEEEEYKEPDTWTIITALNRVLDAARILSLFYVRNLG